MKKTTGILALWVAIALTGACADRNRAAGDDADNHGAGTVGTQRNNNEDQRFIADMLEDGRAEVQLGQLAQTRASRAEVREFGAMMVRDHTKAAEELKTAASATGQPPAPEETNTDHKRLHDKLADLKGNDFDREYINAMVDEHEEAVRELENKSESSDSTQVKQWAAKTLPDVRQHLERARQLEQTIGG